jgi:hypothetical protein
MLAGEVRSLWLTVELKPDSLLLRKTASLIGDVLPISLLPRQKRLSEPQRHVTCRIKIIGDNI